MPSEELVKRLLNHLTDDFSKATLQGALDALKQQNVGTRVQHFSVSLRELSTYSLHHLAPDDETIRRCSWFKQDKDTDGVTRRQRALYASRGGLHDSFIREELHLQPDKFHKGFSSAFKELNKRTHIRPDTVLTDPSEIEAFASSTLSALCEIFDVARIIRGELEQRIEVLAQNEVFSVFIGETIESIDLIAGRYETGIIWCDQILVSNIDSDSIRYEVKGSVDVTLHYGSGDDAAAIADSFPFICTTGASIDAPFVLISDITALNVDTSSWHGI